MSACVCDFDPPSFYKATRRTARKQHCCNECDAVIAPGEQYEHVTGCWENEISTSKTCERCLALRDFIQTLIPCFCFAHHAMREYAIDAAREWNHECSGLLFGALRLEIKIRRYAAQHKWQKK